MWRHNGVLETFAEAAKICCETANKALNDMNRAIHFVKEGNISKLSCKKKKKKQKKTNTDHHCSMAAWTGMLQLI